MINGSAVPWFEAITDYIEGVANPRSDLSIASSQRSKIGKNNNSCNPRV